MSRLNNVSGRQVMRVAERRGWEFKRVRGDHYVYENPPTPHNLSIPDHRELKDGLLRSLIKQMGMSVDEFLVALKD